MCLPPPITEAETPFRHYEANRKQTSVFIERFFDRWPYKNIAEVHDVSIDASRKLYYDVDKMTE